MQSASKNIEKILELAQKEGVITSENKLLRSSLSKMYSKSTMHKQVENVVCKIISEFENIGVGKEAKKR